MPSFPLAVLGAALGATAIWLAVAIIRQARLRRERRADYFGALTPLFERTGIRVEPTGFPRMTGWYQGHAFDLQAIPDTLSFRKLPALWVLVTLPEPQPVEATLDLMIRPTLLEPFSHFRDLPHALEHPHGLPEDCALRTDDPARLPPADVLARHGHLFDDPLMKELVIAPKGLRLVFLAEEAARGRYLIFRDAEMGESPLEPSRLRPVLDALLRIRQDVLEITASRTA